MDESSGSTEALTEAGFSGRGKDEESEQDRLDVLQGTGAVDRRGWDANGHVPFFF